MFGKYGINSQWARQRLEESGFRIAKPRQAILDILQSKGRHLSVSNIYVAVCKICPDVGLASIYRNLELFANMGRTFYRFCRLM